MHRLIRGKFVIGSATKAKSGSENARIMKLFAGGGVVIRLFSLRGLKSEMFHSKMTK